MEGIPYFPESGSDDPEDSIDKKDKKDGKEKKRSVFEAPKEKTPEELNDDKAERKDRAVPLEKLADDEKQQVAVEVVAGMKQDNQQELAEAPADSAEEQAALVGATFAEALEQELDDGVAVEQAIDVAEEKTREIADLEDAPEDSEDDDDDDPAIASPTAAPVASPAHPTPTSTSSRPGAAPPRGPSLPLPRPPAPPVIPPTSRTPRPAFHGGGGPTAMPPSPALGPRVPGLASPDVIEIEIRNRRRERTNLLLGGVIGYMIGRRGGRIRTEKKLLPVQEKLEKQVKDLQQQIFDREDRLRKAARDKYERDPASARRTVDRMEKLYVLRQAEREKVAAKPEKLGKFAVLSERPGQLAEKARPVDRMSLAELLELASGIKIEGSTVKRLFETNRLDEKGLRRVLRSYLRGERYDQALRENLLSSEAYSNPEQLQDNNQSPQTSALKQVLQDSGTSSGFALPSLNESQQTHSEPTYTPGETRQKQLKPIAGMIAVATLVILLILWWVM